MTWNGVERRKQDRGSQPIRKVLVVEDDTTWQEILQLRLTKTAHKIDIVGSIGSMYEKLKDNEYGFIILDNKLPDGMGFDEVKKIKESYPNSHIILLTAYRRNEDTTKLMEKKSVVTVIDKLSDIGLLVNILELKNGLQLLKDNL